MPFKVSTVKDTLSKDLLNQIGIKNVKKTQYFILKPLATDWHFWGNKDLKANYSFSDFHQIQLKYERTRHVLVSFIVGLFTNCIASEEKCKHDCF